MSTPSICFPSSNDELAKILRDVDVKRDFPALLRSLLQFSDRSTCGFSVLPASTFSQISAHFASLSPLSAFYWAYELYALLKSEDDDHSKLLVVLLIRSLLDNVSLMNASKLRAFVKRDIVGECVSLWRLGQSDLASVLTLGVLRTLLMELSYLEAIQGRISRDDLIVEAQEILAEMFSDDFLKFDTGAFLQLSLSLFNSALGKAFPWTAQTTEEAVVCLKKCAKELKTEKERTKFGSLYCASLFDLFSTHLSTFCKILPDDVFCAMFEFLIVHSQSRDNLEDFLQQLAKNPVIRYGDFCERIFRLISDLLLSYSVNMEKAWGIETKDDGTKLNSTQRINEDLLSWDFLLSLTDKCLAEALVGVSNGKIEKIVFSVDFADLQPKNCLRLLTSLMKVKRSLLIPFRSEFIGLMLAEETPKTRSLEFGAKLLEMHAHSADSNAFPAKSDFVSLCLAIFQPIDQLDCDQSAKRDFLLAELTFLRSLFSFLPHLLTSFAPLIVQLLPEFFVLSNFYRRTLRELPGSRFADRLEHSLTSLCREIVRRKKSFQKLLPFVISSSLTGDHELCFPMYLLFSALDENDLALLSSNLSAAEKRKFSRLKAQFYASNKIIG